MWHTHTRLRTQHTHTHTATTSQNGNPLKNGKHARLLGELAKWIFHRNRFLHSVRAQFDAVAILIFVFLFTTVFRCAPFNWGCWTLSTMCRNEKTKKRRLRRTVPFEETLSNLRFVACSTLVLLGSSLASFLHLTISALLSVNFKENQQCCTMMKCALCATVQCSAIICACHSLSLSRARQPRAHLWALFDGKQWQQQWQQHKPSSR